MRVATMTKKNAKLTGTLSGIAGEYLVAGELSRRGYIASITLRNTRGVDILVSNLDANKSVGVQVKTNQNGRREWVLTKKHETDLAKNLFFVFVNLNGVAPPQFFIVPCGEVARYARQNHQKWLKKTSRAGKPHQDNPFRKFRDPEAQFRDRWDLLGLD
jgi:hypothetical protein